MAGKTDAPKGRSTAMRTVPYRRRARHGLNIVHVRLMHVPCLQIIKAHTQCMHGALTCTASARQSATRLRDRHGLTWYPHGTCADALDTHTHPVIQRNYHGKCATMTGLNQGLAITASSQPVRTNTWSTTTSQLQYGTVPPRDGITTP